MEVEVEVKIAPVNDREDGGAQEGGATAAKANDFTVDAIFLVCVGVGGESGLLPWARRFT